MKKNKVIAAVAALCFAAGCAGTENIFSANGGEKISGVPVYAAEENDENTESKSPEISETDDEKETSGKCGDNAVWEYDEKTKTLTISGTGTVTKTFYSEEWYREVKNLIVEDGITGLHGAFYGCKSLESASLPDSINDIDVAFEYCSSLKSLTVPEDVKGIGFGTFLGCSSLEELHFGSDLEFIGWGAISECPALKHIDIPETVTDISEDAFCCSGLESIKLPDNIKIIRLATFASCTDLAEVVLPSKLEHIERDAFRYTAIEKIDIPERTNMIDEFAFASCRSLKEVIIRSDKCTISPTAFFDCDPLPVIKAHKGSTAEEYAETNGFVFEALEESSTSEPGPRIPGDLDLNGKVDITDLTILSVALADRRELSPDSFKNADLTGDGKVELDDLATLKQYLSKKIESIDEPVQISVPAPAGSPVPMD